jgi:hypothetical protein
MNIEKAKQVYKENPALHDILKELFSEEELGLVTPAVSQKEFNKAFNEILEGSTLRYINPETNKVSKKKTSNPQVLNAEGKWLIDYNSGNPHFWYQYDRVYCVLRDKFSLQVGEMKRLMKSLVDTQYKMQGVTPRIDY